MPLSIWKFAEHAAAPCWPSEDLTVDPVYRQCSTILKEPCILEHPSTRFLIEQELNKCDMESWLAKDANCFRAFNQLGLHPNWLGILDILYWRARRQVTIWHCFKYLIREDLLDIKALEAPVSLYRNMSTNAIYVKDVLTSFKFVMDDTRMIKDKKLGIQDVDWDVDIQWLAVMITRSGGDLETIYHGLKESGYLGSSVNERLTSALAHSQGGFRKLEKDLQDSAAELVDCCVPKEEHGFGFLLPYRGANLGGGDLVKLVYRVMDDIVRKRFRRVEEAYRMERYPKRFLAK